MTPEEFEERKQLYDNLFAAAAALDPEVIEPTEVPALAPEEYEARQPLYDELFEGITAQDTKDKSRAERAENEITGLNYTYSEVTMDIVHSVINTLKENFGPLYAERGIFLDLGSGIGKASYAAALLHPFQKVVGIEAVGCLNEIAAGVNTKFQEITVPGEAPKPEVQLIKGDFVAGFGELVEPIASEVTVCFVVATCFGEAEMQAVVQTARLMPENSFVVLISQGLPDTLIRDPDRQPKHRYNVAAKKALAKRGVDPADVGEIIPEPAVCDPESLTLMHHEMLQVPWGGPVPMYIYKKIYPPKKIKAEVSSEIVNSVITRIKESSGPMYADKGIFLDLGSGIGKACCAAALCHPFQKVVGLESAETLSEKITNVSTKYQEMTVPEGMPKPEVQLISADFVAGFEEHVQPIAADVCICFAVTTCFGEAEMQSLSQTARLMPDKSFMVTLSEPIPKALVRDLNQEATTPRSIPDSDGEAPPEPDDNFVMVHNEEIQVPDSDPVPLFIYQKVLPEVVEAPKSGEDEEEEEF